VLLITDLAGAACCAGAAALTWWSATFVDPLAGTITTTATGSELLPELIPVALLALAGLGATFATRGWARRVVGFLVLAGGLVVAVRAVLAMTAAPGRLSTVLLRPARQVGSAELHVTGPLLAVLGGALVAVAGCLVTAGAAGVRGMGARYDGPTRRAAAAARGGRPARGADGDDPGSLWRALDAGTDPTTAGDPAPPSTQVARPGPANPALGTEIRGTSPADPVTGTDPGRLP
jgi:uncharacterized membrane protein (TIGR02234 family)